MKVFISYRRADTQPVALLVARFLNGVPGLEAVFLDVDDIEVAENFQHKILAELPKASHVVVLIGPQWRGPIGPAGTARIFEADDVVRQEVALALNGSAKIVPILVDNTQMPQEADLPQELKRLSKINAFPLRLARFDDDMTILVGRLTGSSPRALAAPLTMAAIVKRAAIGATVGGLLVLGAALANNLWSGDPECRDLACAVQTALGLASRDDALVPMAFLGLAVVAIGALTPFVPRWLVQRRKA